MVSENELNIEGQITEENVINSILVISGIVIFMRDRATEIRFPLDKGT